RRADSRASRRRRRGRTRRPPWRRDRPRAARRRTARSETHLRDGTWPARPAGRREGRSGASRATPARQGPLRSPQRGRVSSLDDVDLERRIRGREIRCRQSELAPDDVAALGDRAGLVERDFPIASLPPETAVARHDEFLGRDERQRAANLGGDVLGPVRLQRAMADGADADLLLQIVSERRKQLEILATAILHLERPDIALATLEVQLDGIRVAG